LEKAVEVCCVKYAAQKARKAVEVYCVKYAAQKARKAVEAKIREEARK